jgi:hypothetical protein
MLFFLMSQSPIFLLMPLISSKNRSKILVGFYSELHHS